MRLEGIRLGSEPGALTALGLTVDGGRARVGGVTLEPAPGEGILGLDLTGAAEGVLPLVEAAPAPPPSVPHPLGVEAVDHVVVVCGDVEATIRALGAEPRRVEERAGRRYGFVLAGTALLEFVGPTEADDRPASPWGLALTVADLDAAVALLGDACGAPRPAVQPGRRIATVRHDQLRLSVPTVLLSPRRARG